MNVKHILLTIIFFNSLPLIGCTPGSAAHSAAEAFKIPAEIKAAADKFAHEDPFLVTIRNGALLSPVAFHPNGKIAAVIITDFIRVYAVDELTGIFKEKVEASFKPTERPFFITFSPSGSFAATTNIMDQTVNIYAVNPETGVFTLVQGAPFATICPNHLMYFSHGDKVAIMDRGGNGIRIYAVDTLTGALSLRPEAIIRKTFDQLALSPDEKLIIGKDNIHNVADVYVLDTNQGIVKPILTFSSELGKISDNTSDIKFFPTGTFIVTTRYSGDTLKGFLRVYKIDEQTKILMPVSSIETIQCPQAIHFFLNGRFAIVSSQKHKNIRIYSVNPTTGKLTHIPANDFTTKYAPQTITFAPNNNLAAITLHNFNTKRDFIGLYEVNHATGALTPITGDLLHEGRMRYMDETRKVLVEPGLSSQAPIMDVLSEYIVGPQALATPKESKEDIEERNRTIAIATTTRQEKAREEDKAKLFEAINKNDSKKVHEYLTPFTINAPDVDDEYRTPLMKAIRLDKPEIIAMILTYRGTVYRYGRKPEPVQADIYALDLAKNNALMLAIINKNYPLALQLARLMKKDEPRLLEKDRKHANVKKSTAFTLAAKDMTTHGDSDDYKQLLELIEY